MSEFKEIRHINLQDESLAGAMEKTLSAGAAFQFTAFGASMLPFIKNGDTLTLLPYKCKPKTGDVAAFVRRDIQKLVVHRIVGRHRGEYIFKGDNCSDLDGIINEKDILGYVVSVQRQKRDVTAFALSFSFCKAYISRAGLQSIYKVLIKIRQAFSSPK